MDLTKLRYFCTTAESGGLRRAADILHVSPGAISKALKSIEGELGLEVFAHSPQGSHLTEDGARLYEYGKRLLVDYDQMRAGFRMPAESPDGLRLGAYCLFTSHLLEEVLAGDLAGVSLLQRRIPPGDLERAILDRRVDLGLTYLPFPQKGLDYLPVTRFAMKCFARPGRFDDLPLAEIPFVTSVTEVQGSAYQVRNIDGWPHERIARNLKYRVAGLDTALGIARRGLAAVYCPTYVAALHNAIVTAPYRLGELPAAAGLPPAEFTIYLVKRIGTPEDRVTRRLTARIRAICRPKAAR